MASTLCRTDCHCECSHHEEAGEGEWGSVWVADKYVEEHQDGPVPMAGGWNWVILRSLPTQPIL